MIKSIAGPSVSVASFPAALGRCGRRLAAKLLHVQQIVHKRYWASRRVSKPRQAEGAVSAEPCSDPPPGSPLRSLVSSLMFEEVSMKRGSWLALVAMLCL